MLLGTSIVSAAYSSYKRTLLNNAERQCELIALSGAALLRDGLEGASVTVKTLTVYKDGNMLSAETQEDEAEFTGSGWVQKLLEGSYNGGGTVTITGQAEGKDLAWICTYSGLNQNVNGTLDSGRSLCINVTYTADEKDNVKKLNIDISPEVSSYSSTYTDGEGHIYINLYKTYVYTFMKGEISGA